MFTAGYAKGGAEAVHRLVEYPPIAKEAGIHGMAIVGLVVDEEGRPTEPALLKSAHFLLGEAAVEAVMQVRFTPGKQRGKPVKVRFAVPVRFVLSAA